MIYSVAKNDARSEIAEALLSAGGVVSVQVINEFAATARRKLGMSWDDIAGALDAIRILCPSPRAMSMETHDAAVRIARTHGVHMYDALVMASALAAGCETLSMEDLQEGQVIEERLTIRNPFNAPEADPALLDGRCGYIHTYIRADHGPHSTPAARVGSTSSEGPGHQSQPAHRPRARA